MKVKRVTKVRRVLIDLEEETGKVDVNFQVVGSDEIFNADEFADDSFEAVTRALIDTVRNEKVSGKLWGDAELSSIEATAFLPKSSVAH